MSERNDLQLHVPPGFERTVQLTREEMEAHVRLMEVGKIEEVTSHLEAVREQGYWLSDEIIATARHMAGELPGSE